jgi:cell fate regulator YaaT (PSP1 superfamily)
MSGVNIVGVQFRRAGKIYSFSADGLQLAIGDVVVVDTDRGMSLAEVKRVNYVSKNKVNVSNLKPVLRIAASKDLKRSGRVTPEQATAFAGDKIRTLNLDMRLIEVDVHFGGNKVIVYFSAPGRVDFRELVKELASGLKSRVELKQVGARDEAKLVGGLGICGREFCCTSWLRDFMPVSIKMAKNQNMALNPSKVSGGCGRLLCCLTYEDKTYQELRKELPHKGTKVKLATGALATVQSGDALNRKVLVETEEKDKILVSLDEVVIVEKSHARSNDYDDSADEEGEELAALVDEDQYQTRLYDESEDETGLAMKPQAAKRDSAHRPSGHQRPQHGERKGQGDEGHRRGSRHGSHRHHRPEGGGAAEGREQRPSPQGGGAHQQHHKPSQQGGNPHQHQQKSSPHGGGPQQRSSQHHGSHQQHPSAAGGVAEGGSRDRNKKRRFKKFNKPQGGKPSGQGQS